MVLSPPNRLVQRPEETIVSEGERAYIKRLSRLLGSDPAFRREYDLWRADLLRQIREGTHPFVGTPQELKQYVHRQSLLCVAAMEGMAQEDEAS
jgi:hypothetical protein